MVLPIKSWHLCHYPLNCSAVYFMRTKWSWVDFIPQIWTELHIPGDYYCLPLLAHHMQKGRKKPTWAAYTHQIITGRKWIHKSSERIEHYCWGDFRILHTHACIMQCNVHSSLCPFTSLWPPSVQMGNTLPPAPQRALAGNPQRSSSPQPKGKWNLTA